MMAMVFNWGELKLQKEKKEKLGLLLRKGEEEEEKKGLKKKSGTFLLYKLKGNNNYDNNKIPIISLWKYRVLHSLLLIKIHPRIL